MTAGGRLAHGARIRAPILASVVPTCEVRLSLGHLTALMGMSLERNVGGEERSASSSACPKDRNVR